VCVSRTDRETERWRDREIERQREGSGERERYVECVCVRASE